MGNQAGKEDDLFADIDGADERTGAVLAPTISILSGRKQPVVGNSSLGKKPQTAKGPHSGRNALLKKLPSAPSLLKNRKNKPKPANNSNGTTPVSTASSNEPTVPPTTPVTPMTPPVMASPPKQADRMSRRRNLDVNLADIHTIRKGLQELTDKMDINQQMKYITGIRQTGNATKDDAKTTTESKSPSSDQSSDQDDESKENTTAAAQQQQQQEEKDQQEQKQQQEDKKQAKRKRHHDMVVQEIRASENLYYRFLTVLHRKFITPLRDSDFVKEQDINSMFSNIEKIAPYHKLIAEKLQTEGIPQVFSSYVKYLKVYTKYVNNYEDACATIARLKTNAKFQKFLVDRRHDPECGGLDLMSYLIMPIQRIPRYRLLLTELMKYTDKDDEDFSHLEHALEDIKTIAAFVNEAKRDAEGRSKIVEIQNRLSGEFENLLSPGRKLVFDADITQKKKSSKTVHVYLFSDLLLWRSSDWEFLGLLPLATCIVDYNYTHKDRKGFSIALPGADDECYYFLCERTSAHTLWTKKIQETIEASQVPLMLMRQRSLSRRQSRKGNPTSTGLPPPPPPPQ